MKLIKRLDDPSGIVSKLVFERNAETLKLVEVHNFDKRDGVHGASYANTCYKSTNGKMYFGGENLLKKTIFESQLKNDLNLP